MLTKWIRCEVTDRAGFDRAQRGWTRLSRLPGFLGQRGGWSGAGTAHVLAFWADQRSYDRFMADDHDELAAGQHRTFDEIDVRLFEHCQDIGENLALAPGSGLVRLAHCTVAPHRTERFARTQASVWTPGMHSAPGFLGGVLGQRDSAEFLVLSQWTSQGAHARYRAERFPALFDRAAPSEDLTAITGHLIALDPAWSVPPAGSTPPPGAVRVAAPRSVPPTRAWRPTSG
ncbi:DUF4937 domain-containing protein [Streptomyces sp. NBC_00454]|uniref:DUF4937 domain-containing protein n=1 Tax=Streptomyces sp. NBC_00454 TaxID=2975747 RepID=UPI0030E42896